MKNSIIAAVLALVTLFVFSGLDLFNTILWFPNFLWILPLYLIYRVSISYFEIVFKGDFSMKIKIGVVLIHIVLAIVLLNRGFHIWKINQGNIFLEEYQEFQLNVKNIWFWVLFQSYLLLLFFSAFKILITIDQKKR